MIYLYDRCLTFKGEVETIWRGSSISIATALYVLLHLSEVLSQCCAVAFNFITGCEVSQSFCRPVYVESTLTPNVIEVQEYRPPLLLLMLISSLR